MYSPEQVEPPEHDAENTQDSPVVAQYGAHLSVQSLSSHSDSRDETKLPQLLSLTQIPLVMRMVPVLHVKVNLGLPPPWHSDTCTGIEWKDYKN